MSEMLALSSGAVGGMAMLGVFLILWFFWWQHMRADVFYDDGFVEEVHHYHYDDRPGGRVDDRYDEDDDYDEEPERPAIDLDSVRVGASIKVYNYPEPDKATRFKATQRNRYVLDHGGSSHTWYEFKLISGRYATWLEWEYDDGLTITQWEDEEIPLSELDTTTEAVREMAKNESGTLRYDGVRYRYANSTKARCFENDGKEEADFESWTFEADDEEQLLSVMLWPGTGGAATARQGWYLSPDELELV